MSSFAAKRGQKKKGGREGFSPFFFFLFVLPTTLSRAGGRRGKSGVISSFPSFLFSLSWFFPFFSVGPARLQRGDTDACWPSFFLFFSLSLELPLAQQPSFRPPPLYPNNVVSEKSGTRLFLPPPPFTHSSPLSTGPSQYFKKRNGNSPLFPFSPLSPSPLPAALRP